jgi:hypothetical protein
MSNTVTRTPIYLPGAAADEFPPNFAEFAAARAKGITTAQAISADAGSGVKAAHEQIGVMTAPPSSSQTRLPSVDVTTTESRKQLVRPAAVPSGLTS